MMISFRSVLFLTGLTLIVASPCFSSHTDITPQQAKDLIDSTKNLIILDVREQFEYCDRGHIPGAVNYPWNSGVLEERYEELINNEILVVCQSGGRSNQAANFLDSKGYTLVYDMQGGMSAWMWETVSCNEPEPKYSGGSGTEADPYQIATTQDLITLGETLEDYDKHFVLTADIDLSTDTGSDFKMIGFYESSRDSMTLIPFTGVFDGNGHTISNFTWDSRDAYVGLFRYVDDPNAEIRNLGLITPRVDAGIYTGSLVGSLKEGTIKQCYVRGGSLSGDDCTGTLVGRNQQGTITDCWSTAAVTGNRNTGGLVGFNYLWGFITNCSSRGTVTGQENTGGLVGHNCLSTLTNSSATGNVNGSWKTGGLVGYNDQSSILNCYSSATVTGVTNTGGLAGLNNFSITMCYSTGSVSGDDYTDPLVGLNLDQVQICFWDTETSGQSESSDGIGKTTAQMMNPNTFISAGWDFVGETVNGPNDIWWILEGRDYPRLWWQLPADDFEDGQPEPLWSVFEIEPELAWLEETNGRLEVNTTGAVENIDAIYVGDGWGLDATKEFSLRVDFHYSKVGIGDGRVNIGVVPSLDPSAMQWAEFEVGAFDEEPFFLYEIRDGDWVREEVTDRFPDSGTLYVSYNPDKDELYFSSTGYGKDKAMWKVTGLVHGRWQSDYVYVILSGGSEGMALTGEDAWLDNFTVDSGAIIQ